MSPVREGPVTRLSVGGHAPCVLSRATTASRSGRIDDVRTIAISSSGRKCQDAGASGDDAKTNSSGFSNRKGSERKRSIVGPGRCVFECKARHRAPIHRVSQRRIARQMQRCFHVECAQGLRDRCRNIAQAAQTVDYCSRARRMRREHCRRVFARRRDTIGCGPRRRLHPTCTDGGEDIGARAHSLSRHNSRNVLPCGAGKSRTANQPATAGTALIVPRRPPIARSTRAAADAARR